MRRLRRSQDPSAFFNKNKKRLKMMGIDVEEQQATMKNHLHKYDVSYYLKQKENKMNEEKAKEEEKKQSDPNKNFHITPSSDPLCFSCYYKSKRAGAKKNVEGTG